jgi:mono/diheme cytochrome c family protein
MMNDERMTKPECPRGGAPEEPFCLRYSDFFRISDFGFRISLAIRHSSFLLLACACSSAAAVDATKLPPPAKVTVDFDRDIEPIFRQACRRCHGPERPRGRFRLDNPDSALKGGDNGVDILPGNSAKSPLIHYVARLVEDMEMPPLGKGVPLKTEQIALLRAWIDQGAHWSAVLPAADSEVAIVPAVRYVGVSGNKAKFREIEGFKEDWAEGLEHFSLKQRVSPETTVTVEGRALAPDRDYRVSLELDKTDVGFVHTGAESWRRYYDDTGGYYRRFNPPSSDLNRDLHLDTGRAWVDFGLTLPRWPLMVVGYEYQFKEGAKSTLEWGNLNADFSSAPPRYGKNIYPAAEDIDERVHIFKFDLTHDLYDWHLEDRARVEIYDLKTTDVQAPQYSFGPTPDGTMTTRQETRHVQGMNTLRLERPVRDWWLVSAGYLYSRLEGDSSFNQTSADASGSPSPVFWQGDDIVLDRQTHLVSASSLFLPADALTLSLAGQGEWTRQKAAGQVLLDLQPSEPPFPFGGLGISDSDTSKASESAGIRLTTIPYTVIFADARLEQEEVDLFQEEDNPALTPFQRTTEASNDRRDLRGGFSTSPWRWFSWSGHYRSQINETDYENQKAVAYQGYPGFLRHREINGDEFQTKLVLRPKPWLTTALTYRSQTTRYSTTTDPASDFMSVLVAPGGELLAGTYRAREYGLHLTLTPYQRLYLSTSFTYSDARTETAQNGVGAVVPYQGDLYSVIANVNYQLNPRTDLHATYSFSQAHYGQNNELEGPPLGLNYTRHGLTAGVSRRLTASLTSNVRYGFYQYSEPSSGGFNNYTAHGVFLSLIYKWH